MEKTGNSNWKRKFVNRVKYPVMVLGVVVILVAAMMGTIRMATITGVTAPKPRPRQRKKHPPLRLSWQTWRLP